MNKNKKLNKRKSMILLMIYLLRLSWKRNSIEWKWKAKTKKQHLLAIFLNSVNPFENLKIDIYEDYQNLDISIIQYQISHHESLNIKTWSSLQSLFHCERK